MQQKFGATVHVQYMYTVTLDFKVILIVVGIIFGIKPEDLVIIIIIIIIIIFMEYTNYALSCPSGWALIRIGSVTNSNRFCLHGNACVRACLLSNEE